MCGTCETAQCDLPEAPARPGSPTRVGSVLRVRSPTYAAQVYGQRDRKSGSLPLSFEESMKMPVKRIATRIAAVGLLTTAGALAIGADQLSALADHLEGAAQDETPGEGIDTDPEAEETEAAARAEGEGYPLGRAGAEGSPPSR